MPDSTDLLLDRIAVLLKLCERADKTGTRMVSTQAVREVLGPAPADRHAPASR